MPSPWCRRRWKSSIPAAAALLLSVPALAAVHIRIEPAVAPIDARVAIRVEGLPPGAPVTVRAEADDAEKRPWRSEALFHADAAGVVDLGAAPAIRGTYTGVDGMGLFWSMQPQFPAADGAPRAAPMQEMLLAPRVPAFPRGSTGTLEVRIEAEAAGAPAVRAIVRRQIANPSLRVTALNEEGRVGRLYEPPGQRLPAVLVLGGGNGGVPGAYAPVLAGHGYVTLALAYFRTEGLPADLVEIPLEYFKGAIDWLRARPSVDPERIGVLGHSRGAEAALLLGAAYPELRAVVALAPSHVAWEGAVRDPRKKGLDALRCGRSAWTLAGRALPFVPRTVTPEVAARVAAHERFEAIEIMRLDSVDLAEVWRARVPVEKINGPVLLVSSLADRMWPAAEMADRVTEALKAGRFPHRVEHLRYDALGHEAPDAWLPFPHGGTVGGTGEGTMRAFGSYWPALLSFLDTSLRERR